MSLLFGDGELRNVLQSCIVCTAVVDRGKIRKHLEWHIKTDTLGDWTIESLAERGEQVQQRARELFDEQGRPIHRDKTWDEIDEDWRSFWLVQAAADLEAS